MNSGDNNKFLNIVAGLFLAGFSVYVLKELSSILIPFVMAIFIAFVFQPFYNYMLKKKFPSFLAIAVILLIIIIFANIAGVFIVAGANSFADNFKLYEDKLIGVFNSLIISLDLSAEEASNFYNSLKISNLLQNESVTKFITGILTGFAGVFGDFILILFYVIFILSEFSSIKNRVSVAFNKEKANKVSSTLDKIFEDVRTYITWKIIFSLILGILSGSVLYLFGSDFYFLWGFLIFLMHFIPSIGALIAIAFPSITMFLQFDNFFMPLAVTIILIVLQNIIGNILEPKVIGDYLNLSPLLLLLSLFMGGYIWGIIGMILSVPIVSIIKIVIMNFEKSNKFSILMSYREEVIIENQIKINE
ncbi:MAG TPA: AI-2E family transporter [Ignavibacteria bacterium]|nr:AI-2E family transporter [Ignavibacteria bacterium]